MTINSPKIIYQDSDILVAEKPPGLLSVPGKGPMGQKSMESCIKSDFPNCRTVHRLDMATSGVMVFANNYQAQVHLNKQFEERIIRKVYVALVEGNPPEAGTIEVPLIADWPNRPKQKVDWKLGKPSTTNFKKLWFDSLNNRSHMVLFPITGRSHQLRVHLAFIGHEILGDKFYGSEENLQYSRLMLHAEQLTLIHPTKLKHLTFKSSAEPSFYDKKSPKV